MNLWFRLIMLMLVARFRPRVSALGPCETPFRVLPTDVDVFMHLTNSAYFALMDLARTDLLLRSPLGKAVKEHGWYPVVAAETIRFYRSIAPLTRFHIQTKVLDWDEHAVVLEQRFVQGDQTRAIASVRAVFLSRKEKRKVRSEELLEAFDELDATAPGLSDWQTIWNDAQRKTQPL